MPRMSVCHGARSTPSHCYRYHVTWYAYDVVGWFIDVDTHSRSTQAVVFWNALLCAWVLLPSKQYSWLDVCWACFVIVCLYIPNTHYGSSVNCSSWCGLDSGTVRILRPARRNAYDHVYFTIRILFGSYVDLFRAETRSFNDSVLFAYYGSYVGLRSTCSSSGAYVR